jgi:hypothetical protein
MSPLAVALHLVYISPSCRSPPVHASTNFCFALHDHVFASHPFTSEMSPPPPPAAAIFQLLLSSLADVYESCFSSLPLHPPLVHISGSCCSLLWRMFTKVASLLYPSTPRPLSFISLAAAALYPVQVSKVGLHSHTHTHRHTGGLV